MKRYTCDHLKFFGKHSPITGFYNQFPEFCDRPDLCTGCAERIGEEYENYIVTAINLGRNLYHDLATRAEFVSMRRSFNRKFGSTSRDHYFAVPTLDDMVHVWHDVPGTRGEMFIISNIGNFDWSLLAHDKYVYAQSRDSRRANVSGQLGHAKPVDDGKEPYADIAIHVDSEIKVEAMPIILDAGKQAFAKHGSAQNVSEAEAQIKTLLALVVSALDKAGIDKKHYEIMRCVSRATFQAITAKATCSESDNGNFEAELIMLGERYLADH